MVEINHYEMKFELILMLLTLRLCTQTLGKLQPRPDTDVFLSVDSSLEFQYQLWIFHVSVGLNMFYVPKVIKQQKFLELECSVSAIFLYLYSAVCCMY